MIENTMLRLHDNDLEKKVLGAIMFDWQLWNEVNDIFTEDLFVNQNHKNIAKVIISIQGIGKPSELIAVITEMKKRNYFSDFFTIYDLSTLCAEVASSANTGTHMRYLQELYLKRKVVLLAEQAIRSCTSYNSDIFDIIDTYEKGLTELTDNIITTRIHTMPVLYQEALRINERIVSMDGALSGVTSGFRVIDQITGGWQDEDLIILAADAGMGKSSLALEFAKRPALLGIPTGVLSGEMSARQLFARMISQTCDIELQKILRTGMDKWDLQTVEERTLQLNRSPLYIDDSNMNIFEVCNKARKMVRKYNIKLLIIDYLQLIEVHGMKNRADAVGFISRKLKALAKELHIPIIAISSMLNKDIAKRPGKVPHKSDLRESGNIEFDADLICLLYRPEYYKIMVDDFGQKTEGKCMFMIEKHRNGALATPVLGFDGRYTKFYTIGVDDPKPAKLAEEIQANLNFENENDIIT